MEKCKFCQQELAEDSTVCPHCGRDNAEEVKEESTSETVQETGAPETVQETGAPETVSESEEEIKAEMPEIEIPVEKKKAGPGKIALAVGIIVVLAAVLVALIVAAVGGNEGTAAPTTPSDILETAAPTEATVPADGNPDDATCKGTYTVTDEEVKAQADEIVATAGEHQLTNAQLQVFYWMEYQSFMNQYGPYAAAFGLNPEQSLDTQICGMTGTGTWQQFFLSSALGTWQNYLSMASEAEKAGHEMPAELLEFLDNMVEDMEKSAKENGFEDAAAMLAYNVGAGADIQDYVHFMELYQKGYVYFADMVGAFEATEEDLETYFADHEEAMAAQGVTKDTQSANVRHILISVSPEDTENEEVWKAAETKANEVLAQWNEGEKTEDSFAALAMDFNEDPGSKPNGGLYTGVLQGQMVPEFDAWCFDDARKAGDTGIVKTDFGYHIMFYVGSEPVWKAHAEKGFLDEKTQAFIEEASGKYPLDVDYSAIKLGLAEIAK